MENFDHSKAAQLSATFSISMFLSICILASKTPEGWNQILMVLWTASGLFGAAAMKYVDAIFDNATDTNDEPPWFSVLSVNGKHFFSLDSRWKNIGFILYLAAWISFLVAFYLVGIKVFNIDSSLGFYDLALSHTWFFCVLICLMLSTLFASTYDFLFIR